MHRAEKRELLLELVRLDDRHQLRARHRALQLLAVQELGLDLLPLALPAGPRESLGAPGREIDVQDNSELLHNMRKYTTEIEYPLDQHRNPIFLLSCTSK